MALTDKTTVMFRHGGLAPSYEEQANEQGFTFNDKADFIQRLGDGLVMAHIHGVLTDSQFDKAIEKFHKKVIVKHLKRLDTPTIKDGKE